MLRFFLLLLIALNAALWGWQQGWFGEAPSMAGREPKRVSDQINPTFIEVTQYTSPATNTPPDTTTTDTRANTPKTEATEQIAQTTLSNEPENIRENSSNSTDTSETSLLLTVQENNMSSTTSCIESGPLNKNQTEQFQKGIVTILPNNDMWRLDVQNEATSWIVYIGKFPSEDEARKRKAELANIGLMPELTRGRAHYEPGLSFDMFRAEENAKRRLAEVRNKGVNDARIVPWTENPIGQLLQIPLATPDQKEQLDALANRIGAPAFRACKTE